MKREVLLVIAVLVVAIASVAVLFVSDTKTGRPLACFVHGGSNTGVCKS